MRGSLFRKQLDNQKEKQMESNIQDIIFGILSKFRELTGFEVQLKIDSSGMTYLVELGSQKQICRFDTLDDFLQIQTVFELVAKRYDE